EWVVPDPVSPVADWRPWPYVHVHFSEPESPPFPPEQTFLYEELVEFGPVPRPTGFRSTISTGVPSPTVVFEPAASYVASDTAGPSVPADKGKAHMLELDIPAEFLTEDAQARKCLEEEQATHNGTIIMQKVRAMNKQQLIEEYEYI
nr:hypothetical protein [Tanacetum cinerariifolium]